MSETPRVERNAGLAWIRGSGVCRKWNGTPHPHEGQALKWVAPVELTRYPMPPADLPLIGLLRDLL